MKPRNKKIAIGAGILVTLAIIGTVVGVVVTETKKNNRSNNNSSQNSQSSSSRNGNTPTATSSGPASTPSAFPLDPNLHKSFYGIAYTPYGAIMPECGASQANVTKDIQVLSQLTNRLRLYGSDCNVTSFVLQGIQDAGVDMTIFAAIYLETEEESYTRQKTILQNALTTYGTSKVAGVAVGNEYVFTVGGEGGSTETAAARVATKMNEVRTDLAALGHNLPVGTSDTGGTLTQGMFDAADFVFANIHPWFSGNAVAGAATFANSAFTQTQNMAALSPRTPEVYQGEYGWPSASDAAGGTTNGAGSEASEANLQIVLNDWVCQANTAGTKYFWFSAFDEVWKAVNGGIEAHWGLFNADGTLKGITIPVCTGATP